MRQWVVVKNSNYNKDETVVVVKNSNYNKDETVGSG